MLIWGTGGKTVELGVTGTAPGAACEQERTFKEVLADRYAHIWYLFRWVSSRSDMRVREICGRGAQHDRRRYEAEHGTSAIPLFDRAGGWVLLALIVVFAVFAGRQSDVREASLLTQPKVGDLYSAKVDTFSDGFDGLTYGVMRVSAVDAQSVSLQIPNGGYSGAKGVSKDLRDRETGQAGYFSEEIVKLPHADLAKRHDGGDIYDVAR